jgi:uncharacterized RDD family membrane protein YckC
MSDLPQAPGGLSQPWRRVFAMVVDINIVWFVVAIVQLALFYRIGGDLRAWPFQLTYYFVLPLYLLVLEWRFGSTAGKRLLGIAVRSAGGGSLSFAQALKRVALRSVPLTLSIVTLFLPPEHNVVITELVVLAAAAVLIVNVFVATGRGTLAWHDRWAGTEVIVRGPPLFFSPRRQWLGRDV